MKISQFYTIGLYSPSIQQQFFTVKHYFSPISFTLPPIQCQQYWLLLIAKMQQNNTKTWDESLFKPLSLRSILWCQFIIVEPSKETTGQELIFFYFWSCLLIKLNQFLSVISILHLYEISHFTCLAKELIVAFRPVWIRAISLGIRLHNVL